MDKLSSIAKGGWHPEKTGSVKGDLKSWVGRGDSIKTERERAEAHNTTPLSALRDPSSFAPPPKRTGTGDFESPIAGSSTTTGSSRPVPLPPRASTNASTSQEQPLEDERPPSGPFRVDTTGLSTVNLPKPPIRRIGSPVTTSPAQIPVRSSNLGASTNGSKKPGPPLPPRLPPRNAIAVPTEAPPTYDQATVKTSQQSETQHDGDLNAAAIGRLGAAGISVPGLNIGGSKTEITPPVIAPDLNRATISELQSRLPAPNSSAQVAEDHAGFAIRKKPVPLPSRSIAGTSSNVDAESSVKPGPPPIPFGTKPR